MPVWNATRMEVETDIDLVQWRIFEIVPDGTCHLVGRNAGTHSGRVSTAIQEFDVSTGKGRTRSGRTYQLVGCSDFAGVAEYVWTVWCARHRVEGHIDVTHLYEREVPDDHA